MSPRTSIPALFVLLALLVGAVGQPDAGAMTGGVYTLGGGFWEGVKALFYRYAHLALKN